ncbi:MAG: L,D-transpeptidase [Thermomicrobiales bacterium]|nr:L,D-transpeptidase [Thermomicrobiales bacterium]
MPTPGGQINQLPTPHAAMRRLGDAIVSIAWSVRARRALLASALALTIAAGALPDPAAAEGSNPPTVFVAETGHTTDRLFLDAWRAQQTLFGDPITEEFHAASGFVASGDDSRVVQYYENVALVYVPDAANGNPVQTLALGTEALRAQLDGRPSTALQRADRRTACGPDADECLTFAETGHTLRGALRDYWEANDGMHWLGQPITEPFRAADGSAIQYFEHAALRQTAHAIAPLPLGRMLAQQHDLDIAPIERPQDVPVYEATLFTKPADPVEPERPTTGKSKDATSTPTPTEEAPIVETAPAPQVLQVGWPVGTAGPGPQQGAWKEIVVSISQQSAWVYENGDLVASTFVSTGTGNVPETITPPGMYSILTKYDVQTMEGVIAGEEYKVPDVPDVMYFDNLGNALHGAYWHNNFGTPMSHGCINLPLDFAAWLYGWAPIGTAVTVVS